MANVEQVLTSRINHWLEALRQSWERHDRLEPIDEVLLSNDDNEARTEFIAQVVRTKDFPTVAKAMGELDAFKRAEGVDEPSIASVYDEFESRAKACLEGLREKLEEATQLGYLDLQWPEDVQSGKHSREIGKE